MEWGVTPVPKEPRHAQHHGHQVQIPISIATSLPWGDSKGRGGHYTST